MADGSGQGMYELWIKDSVWEMELKALTNIVKPSVKSRSRSVGRWKWAGCIMVDVCTKFH